MDNNVPNFEGCVVPPNNPHSKSYVSSTRADRGRVGINFWEIIKEMTTEPQVRQTFHDLLLPLPTRARPNVGYMNMKNEANAIEGVETIFSLEGIPKVANEREDQTTLHDLMPSHVRARPNASHEREGYHEFMRNPLLAANQQQKLLNLSSSLNQISSQDFIAYQPPLSSDRSCIGHGTASQLKVLQDQTLIYNYMMMSPLNMIVPPHHCLPSSSSSGFFPSFPTTWGSFRQDNALSSGDPEHGRCRRSDGKKWRCSNNVVADEKYCEKHRYRGRVRQRSRKTTRRERKAPGDVTGTTVPGTSSGVPPARVESDVSKPVFANSSVADLFNW